MDRKSKLLPILFHPKQVHRICLGITWPGGNYTFERADRLYPVMSISYPAQQEPEHYN